MCTGVSQTMRAGPGGGICSGRACTLAGPRLGSASALAIGIGRPRRHSGARNWPRLRAVVRRCGARLHTHFVIQQTALRLRHSGAARSLRKEVQDIE